MIDSVVDSTRIPYFWDKTLPNSGLTGAADSKDEVTTALPFSLRYATNFFSFISLSALGSCCVIRAYTRSRRLRSRSARVVAELGVGTGLGSVELVRWSGAGAGCFVIVALKPSPVAVAPSRQAAARTAWLAASAGVDPSLWRLLELPFRGTKGFGHYSGEAPLSLPRKEGKEFPGGFGVTRLAEIPTCVRIYMFESRMCIVCA